MFVSNSHLRFALCPPHPFSRHSLLSKGLITGAKPCRRPNPRLRKENAKWQRNRLRVLRFPPQPQEKLGHFLVRIVLLSEKTSGLNKHLFHIVSYPAIQPPPSTAFKCYARKRSKTSETGSDQQDLLIVGETPSIELVSNYEITKTAAEAGCRYVVVFRVCYAVLTGD